MNRLGSADPGIHKGIVSLLNGAAIQTFIFRLGSDKWHKVTLFRLALTAQSLSGIERQLFDVIFTVVTKGINAHQIVFKNLLMVSVDILQLDRLCRRQDLIVSPTVL